ncbi:MAG: ROK family protein [Candidatus Omnitrophica bacterium]|nr:ROK family protein [Candidatus Omnitrophota bacterium]
MKTKYIIGIDLGGTNLKIALLNTNYKIKSKQFLSTKCFKKKEALITAICDSIIVILAASNLSRNDILGVGLGLPGPINSKDGIVHFFPNIPGWKEVGLRKILQAKLKIPVSLDNDANLMSLAEFRLGAAKECKNAICITLGTGVGGGLIINGSLYRGSAYASGEIGHVPINEVGVRCNCGGEACLEAYVGNNRILEQARKAFGRNITLEELSVLALRKNKLAVKIWDDFGRRLGIALTGVVNLLNLDAIVIGGGVANAGNFLFNKIKQTIDERAMSVQARHVKIFKAKLGSDAGMIGAAILVKEGI